MSAPEPTAEHWGEANTLAAEWTLLHLGNTGATANNLEVVLPRMIARALAAAEARGAEKAPSATIEHTMALEAQNVALLRWQSVASDAHVGHICALIRSLAVSDETPRTLRDLSAMGVEEEVRRIVAAERINREKSEVSAREWRKKAENAEADALDAEARGFERGQKTNPAAVWGWAAAVGGDGWLLCPMVLRGDRLVVDANDVRGMIFGEPGREGYAAVRRLRTSQYTKRVRRKTMEGARSALSKLMGESIPALPDSKEPR